MIWNRLFSPDSFCDKGTLKQLVNLIHRPKITSKVKQNFTAVQDFFSVIQGDLQHATSEAKAQYFSKCVDTIVTRFMLHHVQTLENENSISPDGVFEYACSVIGLGLMARNFSDAIHEGDGERLLRCWKFFMLHFKEDSCSKYAIEAFNLIGQVNATLTPQMAHKLIWNRTCNVRGGEENNIPLDLQNEHLNRTFKDDINTFGANVSDRSVSRSSKQLAQ